MKRENKRVENLHERTPRQLSRTDTVYGTRMLNGHMQIFFGRFVELRRGAIVIHGIWIEPEHQFVRHDNVPHDESFRVDKCYLWGKGPGDSWPRCHWFRRGSDYSAT